MTTANERIKELRKALGLKQHELANALGLSTVMLNYIENGKRSLTERNAKYICDKYNVNVQWLLTGEGDMFIQKEPATASQSLHAFVDKAIEDNGEMLQVLNLLNQIQNKQS